MCLYQQKYLQGGVLMGSIIIFQEQISSKIECDKLQTISWTDKTKSLCKYTGSDNVHNGWPKPKRWVSDIQKYILFIKTAV